MLKQAPQGLDNMDNTLAVTYIDHCNFNVAELSVTTNLKDTVNDFSLNNESKENGGITPPNTNNRSLGSYRPNKKYATKAKQILVGIVLGGLINFELLASRTGTPIEELAHFGTIEAFPRFTQFLAYGAHALAPFTRAFALTLYQSLLVTNYGRPYGVLGHGEELAETVDDIQRELDQIIQIEDTGTENFLMIQRLRAISTIYRRILVSGFDYYNATRVLLINIAMEMSQMEDQQPADQIAYVWDLIITVDPEFVQGER